MKILHITIAIVLGWMTPVGIHVATAADIDMSGTWSISVEYLNNIEKAEILLIQKGNALSGTYNSKFNKSALIDGSLSGNVFEIRIDREEGSDLIYKGVIDGATMKGSASVRGRSSTKDFTGEKQ